MRHAILAAISVSSIVLPGLIISISLCQASPLAYASPDSSSFPATRRFVDAGASQPAVTVSGELKKWHAVTVTLEGPAASETGAPNPFLDYRFEVVFSLANTSITVPGYFAADGNASETGAESGNVWRAHFVPPETGSWTYRTSFREGTDVALSTDPSAGNPVSDFDNIFGSFTIGETDKSGSDFRGKGKLRYVGDHYLRFDNGEYYIKGGADSPENLLAYEDFDGTYNNGGPNFIKSYTNHVQHWNTGDPTWKNGKGKGLIGALNYLASKGMNSVYFITMNVNGDGNDVWPWTGPGERFRFDVSKLDQWNITFDHMDRRGILLHVLTQETENERLLDGGDLGRQRKVYYRELIARFGYHLGIVWNLGEENDENTTTQRKAFADYIRALDPYDHPIVIHTFPGQYDAVYTPLLNYPAFEGASLQAGVAKQTHALTRDWVTKSANAAKKWIVCMDEAGPWNIGVTPDGPGNNHDEVRKEVLWGNLMAGGCGVEWYFGYDYPNHDLNAEDWTTREEVWNFTRYALEFFHNYLPFVDMKSNDGLASNTSSYVFAKEGAVYAVYLKNGGTTSLNIGGASKTYAVKWYNPRKGGALQDGAVAEVTGPGNVSIGQPPGETSLDWVALVREATESTVVYGDATVDGLLSALDASLILQHGIGLIELPPAVVDNVDVSANGTITAYDGSLILQRIVELIPCFPVDPACSTGKRTASETAPTASLSERVEHADSRSITLRLESSGGAIQSMNVDLRYDASTLNFEGLSDRLPAGWRLVHQNEEGRVRLAIAGTPASLQGDVLTFRFESPGSRAASPITAHVQFDESAPVTLTLSAIDATPESFALDANYPNPFNPSTVIAYALSEASRVRLEVFDVTGRSVAMLVDQTRAAGRYSVSFDAAGLPSGLYFYRLTAGNFTSTRKMTLAR